MRVHRAAVAYKFDLFFCLFGDDELSPISNGWRHALDLRIYIDILITAKRDASCIGKRQHADARPAFQRLVHFLRCWSIIVRREACTHLTPESSNETIALAGCKYTDLSITTHSVAGTELRSLTRTLCLDRVSSAAHRLWHVHEVGLVFVSFDGMRLPLASSRGEE